MLNNYDLDLDWRYAHHKYHLLKWGICYQCLVIDPSLASRHRPGGAALPLPPKRHPRQVRVFLQGSSDLPSEVLQWCQEWGQVSGHQGEDLGLHELQAEDHQALKTYTQLIWLNWYARFIHTFFWFSLKILYCLCGSQEDPILLPFGWLKRKAE